MATGAGSIVDRTKYPTNRLRTDAGADGTGPYSLTSFTNEQARLTPNRAYRGIARTTTGSPVLMRYYKTRPRCRRHGRRGGSTSSRARCAQDAGRPVPSDPDQRVTEADSTETRNLVLDVRADSPCTTAGYGRRWPR
ncbi:hypothetical protein [Streptomyces stelliscabiei]|uniref:hypothetical protein n=1 Tax=Streptomyces stelliscabiei TaxID=146820 RepID=UPI003A901568